MNSGKGRFYLVITACALFLDRDEFWEGQVFIW
jgi:hypothetical protein